MTERRVERIGLSHLLAAVPALHSAGHDEVAAELTTHALTFTRALAAHRHSTKDRDPLGTPLGLDIAPLARALTASADLLRQGTEAEVALGSWCVALAARLVAMLTVPGATGGGARTFAAVGVDGDGELVIVHPGAAVDSPR